MELVLCDKWLQKLINKNTFNHSTYLTENLDVVCLDNTIIIFDKPMYIGENHAHVYWHRYININFFGFHRF